MARKFFQRAEDGGLLDQEAALFVLSREDPASLKRHFRHFTKARDSAGLVMLLRFYERQTFADLMQVLPKAQFGALHGAHQVLNLRKDGRFTLTRAVTDP